MGHVHSLPRRHRLGRERRRRGRHRVERVRPPAIPQPVLRRGLPRLMGVGRAVSGEPGYRRRRDLGHLCGIEAARASGDREGLEAAIRRLVLLYSVAYSYGGIPLVYMGDELALPNDTSYRNDPATRDDNRWMHRPRMDWEAAERRHDPTTVEGRVFAAAFRALAEARKRLIVLRAGGGCPPPADRRPSRLRLSATPSPQRSVPRPRQLRRRAAQLRRRPPGRQWAGAVRGGDVFGGGVPRRARIHLPP
jgi:hypothetical protein